MTNVSRESAVTLPSTVARCIRDAGASRLALEVLKSYGAASTEISWADLVNLDAPPAWHALIYDLSPWDRRAKQGLQQCCSISAAPILLYPPAVPGVGSLLEACPHGGGLMIKFQFVDPQERERLSEHVRRLLHQIPKEQIAVLLRTAFSSEDQPVLRYVLRGLDAVTAPIPSVHPTAHAVADAAGVSVRTVERVLRASGMPCPKELLNWLPLLYITLVAERVGQSLASVARSFGWVPSDLYRLRRRLLHRASWPPSLSDREPLAPKFDLVLAAFLKRCGIPEGRRREVLARAG